MRLPQKPKKNRGKRSLDLGRDVFGRNRSRRECHRRSRASEKAEDKFGFMLIGQNLMGITDRLKKIEVIIKLRSQELSALDDLIKARFVEMFGDPEINPYGYPVRSMAEIASYWNGLTYIQA